jgi:hypothetical protein
VVRLFVFVRAGCDAHRRDGESEHGQVFHSAGVSRCPRMTGRKEFCSRDQRPNAAFSLQFLGDQLFQLHDIC